MIVNNRILIDASITSNLKTVTALAFEQTNVSEPIFLCWEVNQSVPNSDSRGDSHAVVVNDSNFDEAYLWCHHRLYSFYFSSMLGWLEFPFGVINLKVLSKYIIVIYNNIIMDGIMH